MKTTCCWHSVVHRGAATTTTTTTMGTRGTSPYTSDALGQEVNWFSTFGTHWYPKTWKNAKILVWLFLNFIRVIFQIRTCWPLTLNWYKPEQTNEPGLSNVPSITELETHYLVMKVHCKKITGWINSPQLLNSSCVPGCSLVITNMW